MAEIATNFPPQTYSSSFFLNSIVDDDKVLDKKARSRGENGEATSPPLLDCFVSTFLFGEKRSSAKERRSNKCLEVAKSGDKDIEVAEIWKSRHAKPVRSQSPQNAFKRWRKTGLKNSESKSHQNDAKKVANNINEKTEEDMSLLKFLAINALDLSAPASDVLLKSRSSNWFQLSGHPDSLAPAGPGTVWKKRSGGPDDTERVVYEELSQDPSLKDIIPKYYREVDYQGEKFIELQDLLHGFQDPYVVDIKMGTRTFLESEVKKSTARPDLYQKMIAIDPDAPTLEEHQMQAVTKLRYMQFREQQSSTCSHGFRIEAMKCRGSPPVTDLKKVKSNEDVFHTLDMYFGGRTDIIQRVLKRLYEMRSKIEQSEYFKTHEIVGSSIFMIYDDYKVGIWIIDFAKTNKLPDGVIVNHRKPWVQGNHEEGLLFGFDQLISVIEEISKSANRGRDTFSKAIPAVRVKS